MALIGYAHWRGYAIPVYDDILELNRTDFSVSNMPLDIKYSALQLSNIPIYKQDELGMVFSSIDVARDFYKSDMLDSKSINAPYWSFRRLPFPSHYSIETTTNVYLQEGKFYQPNQTGPNFESDSESTTISGILRVFVGNVKEDTKNIATLITQAVQIQGYTSSYDESKWYSAAPLYELGIGNPISFSSIQNYVVLTDTPLGNDIYDPGGNSKPTGGGGSFDDGPSDDISKDIPAGSVAGNISDTSTFTRYLVNEQYLNIFGEWLWTTDLGLAVAKSVISAIYGDPAESVISLMSYPFNLNSIQGVTRTTQNLFWGSFDSGLPFIALTSNAGTIDWGTLKLKEYWGNFLDYSPHTKLDLYLPWGTGFVSIDPGECLPGTIQVKTNVDLAKGSCTHFVIGNKGSVIATYAGQCAQQIPIFSTDFASKIAGMVTAAAAGITVGTAGAIGATTGYNMGKGIGTYDMQGNFTPQRTGKYKYIPASIVEAEDQAISNVQSTGKMAGKIATTSLAINKAPTHVSRNGGFTDGSAGLGIQYPYLIISRPTQSVPKQYGQYYGYPSNIFVSLSDVKGYTEVGEIHLDGQTTATSEELNEIDRILKEGVIL